MEQRIILLGGAQFEPDAPETVERLQAARGHMAVVVPDQPAAERRDVSEQGGAEEEPQTEPRPDRF